MRQTKKTTILHFVKGRGIVGGFSFAHILHSAALLARFVGGAESVLSSNNCLRQEDDNGIARLL